MRLKTAMLTCAFATTAVVAACGGSSHKKTLAPPGDAGAAGEAGGTPLDVSGNGGATAPESEAGASGSETAGAKATGGDAGAGGSSAGAAGAPDAAGAPGNAEAGAGPVDRPPVHVLFTVAPGAQGLAGSALADRLNSANLIFGSRSESPDPSAGTNEVVFTAAQLGLGALDAIDAFSVISPEPQAPMYLFSIAGSGIKSVRPTRLNRSSVEGAAPGDVYFSDAVASYHSLGEGGDLLGYNGLLANEESLGLYAAPPRSRGDDLTGVQPLLGNMLPTEIYFSVAQSSTGLPGTGIATTNEDERGCTIYKSAVDGTNSVAYRCAELGLVADAEFPTEITGLSVLGAGTPSKILFTVSQNAVATPLSAVDDAQYPANNVYESTGDGKNSLRVAGSRLGLRSGDVLDALSVVDRAPPIYGTASSCNLSPYPYDAASTSVTLATFVSAHGLGPGLILLTGHAASSSGAPARDAILAYDVKTCDLVARAELPYNALQGRGWTPVPLAGWSRDQPLQNLEYWQFFTDDGLRVERTDAAGQPLSNYGFDGIPEGSSTGYQGFSLDYDVAHDRFVGVLNPGAGALPDYARIVFARPPNGTPESTPLPVLFRPLPHPCAYAPDLSGVDAQGNTFFAQYDFSATNEARYRVCPLSPSGEFAAPAFSAQASFGQSSWGMIVPGDSIYTLFSGYFTLARQALTSP